MSRIVGNLCKGVDEMRELDKVDSVVGQSVGAVALFVLGLMPYVVVSFAIVLLWNKHIGFTALESVGFWEYTNVSILSIGNILGSLSLLGGWFGWYLVCKLFKYMLWTRL